MRDTLHRLREGFLDHWVDGAMALYYLGIVTVGLVGFHDPSISISQAIGSGYLIYAVGMVLMGTLAILSIAVGSRRSEAACLVAIGALTVLHGFILFKTGSGGVQTGIRLMCAMLGALPFAFYRAETVYTRRDLRRYLRAAEEAQAADEARKDRSHA